MATPQQLTARYIIAVVRSGASVDFTIGRRKGSLSDDLRYAASEDGIQKLIILPWVNDVRWRVTPAVAVTFTQGSSVLERGETKLLEVTLSGDVGPMPQRWPGRPAETVAASVQALEDLVAWCTTEAADDSLTMHLYAMNEGVAWEVVPIDGPQVSRPRSNRTGQHYDLTLRILGPVEPPTIKMLTWVSAKSATFGASPLTAALKAVRVASATVKATMGQIQAARDLVDKQVLRPLDRLVSEMFGIGEDLTSMARDMEQWAAGILRRPGEWALRAERLSREIKLLSRDAKRDFYDRFRQGGGDESPWQVTIGKRIESASVVSGVLNGMDRSVDACTVAEQLIRIAAQAEAGRVGVVPVRTGDSIEGLAARYVGAGAGVADLVALNGLRHPYVSSVRMPGVLGPGDRIRVPVASAAATTTIQLRGQGLSDDDDLGTDWSMTAGGDYALRVDADGVADLAVVSGVENVAQNISARIRRIKGRDLLWRRTGLPIAIGQGATQERLAAWAIDVMRELRADSRVMTVQGFAVTTEGNAARFRADLDLRNGQSLAVPDGGA